MTHIKPLADHELPQSHDAFEAMRQQIGYVPNSFWTLGWRPDILDAFRTLAQVVFTGPVDPGLKSLVAVMSSYAAGCRYCQAHQATASLHRGVSPEKLAALAEFEHSPLFTDAERAALRLAFVSGQQPNGASAEHFDAMTKHYTEAEIVEIVAVIALFGFLNRWNETMATELEPVPMTVAREHLTGLEWEPGRHRAE